MLPSISEFDGVRVLEPLLPDGSPAPLAIGNGDSDRPLELLIRWSEADARRLAQFFFAAFEPFLPRRDRR